MADTDVQAPESANTQQTQAPSGTQNGSSADPQQRTQQNTQQNGSPANAAFAAMRKENSQLKSEFEKYREETKPLMLLAQALKESQGGGQSQADPDTNPYDPVTDLDNYNKWNRQREQTVTQTATQTAEQTASKTASTTYQRERRVELTSEAEDAFLSQHPDFSDGAGNWRDDLKSTVVAEAAQMMRNGQGSGKYGAVTAQDIENLLWKNPATRSQMQTLSVRNAEGRTINAMQQAEQTRRPRGTVNLSEITTVEEARQALNNLGVDTVEAARLMDKLPDNLVMQL